VNSRGLSAAMRSENIVAAARASAHFCMECSGPTLIRYSFRKGAELKSMMEIRRSFCIFSILADAKPKDSSRFCFLTSEEAFMRRCGTAFDENGSPP